DANPYEAFAALAATGNETATAPKPASRTWSRTRKSALPPVRQGDGKTTGRPREAGAPHRGAPRSEPEARAHVVAALVHAHVVEVIAPLRVATLVLAGQVGALHVERDVGRDVVADRRIQVAHRLVPDGELVAPGRGVGLAKALAAPVVGDSRLRPVALVPQHSVGLVPGVVADRQHVAFDGLAAGGRFGVGVVGVGAQPAPEPGQEVEGLLVADLEALDGAAAAVDDALHRAAVADHAV